MLLLSVILLFLAATDAMLPRECIQGKTKFPVVCCPDYNGSPCGAADNRGNCLALPKSRAMENPDVRIDDRYSYPIFYFSYVCQCKFNYYGVNCGECIFGYTGIYCDQAVRNIRLEYRELTPAQREAYLAKINYCKVKLDPQFCILRSGDRFRSWSYECIDASYWDTWCFSHYWATKPFVNNTVENFIVNYAHGSSNFPTWHRLSLLILERQLQKCLKDVTFSLVYYDWGFDQNCSACEDGWYGGNDIQGKISKWSAFSTWRMICGNFDYDGTYCLMSDCLCERPVFTRNPGSVPGFSKPGPLDIQHCLDLVNYDTSPYNSVSRNSFRNCLEGWRTRYEEQGTSMHNAWHVYCSGTMAQVPISCNDPMFVSHHVFIDKIFEMFIRNRKLTRSSYPSDNQIYGHRYYDCITPFYPCWLPGDLLVPCTQFGVDYSNMRSYYYR